MRTNTFRKIFVLHGFLISLSLPKPAHAQIYVANGYTIGEYALSGQPINSSLISDSGAAGLALDGNGDIFVGNGNSGIISEYSMSGGNKTLFL
jgi:hypothetical protein